MKNIGKVRLIGLIKRPQAALKLLINRAFARPAIDKDNRAAWMRVQYHLQRDRIKPAISDDADTIMYTRQSVAAIAI